MPRGSTTTVTFRTVLYPIVTIPRIKNPNRMYAFPFFGGFVKIIMLIPVFVWLFLLGIAFGIMTLINSFVVLFTGEYWKSAYEVNVLLIKLSLKTSYFFVGLTNAYPGFNGNIKDFSVEIPFPKHPNRWFAFPLLGGLVRGIILIPYLIYANIMQYAGHISAGIASLPVFFTGNYPEALYELPRDSIRLSTAILMYFSGLSDNYPSFWISMKHKGVKITLIILAILFFLFNSFTRSHKTYSQNQNNYYQAPPNATY